MFYQPCWINQILPPWQKLKVISCLSLPLAPRFAFQIQIIKKKHMVFFHSREFSKPLLPVGRAGVLLAEILHLLCKQMVSAQVLLSSRGRSGCSARVHAWNLHHSHVRTFRDGPASPDNLGNLPRTPSFQPSLTRFQKVELTFCFLITFPFCRYLCTWLLPEAKSAEILQEGHAQGISGLTRSSKCRESCERAVLADRRGSQGSDKLPMASDCWVLIQTKPADSWGSRSTGVVTPPHPVTPRALFHTSQLRVQPVWCFPYNSSPFLSFFFFCFFNPAKSCTLGSVYFQPCKILHLPFFIFSSMHSSKVECSRSISV